MLQALSTCAINHETTGAAVVAWVFMGIFATLIVGDAVATGFALAHAINRDAKAIKQTVQGANPEGRPVPKRAATASAYRGF